MCGTTRFRLGDHGRYVNMNPRLKYITIALVLASVFAWYFFSRQQPIQIPQANDVITISASLYNRPDSGNEIFEFTIPKSHHAKILDLFRDAQPDSRPSKWQVLGFVKIKSENDTISISLYRTGDSTGAFRTSQRSYYRGSSDNAIIQAVDAAKADAK